MRASFSAAPFKQPPVVPLGIPHETHEIRGPAIFTEVRGVRRPQAAVARRLEWKGWAAFGYPWRGAFLYSAIAAANRATVPDTSGRYR